MFGHENIHDGKLVPRSLCFARAAACALVLVPIPGLAQGTTAAAVPPAPQAKVVQTVTLAGAWRADVTKKKVGTGDRGESFYQWALSIYAYDGSAFRLKFRSPRDGGPLTPVMKATGADLWFPIQTAKVIGPATLAGRRMLVVQSHEFAADCGLGTVTVFALDGTTGIVRRATTATNGCELTAKIVHGAAGDEIRLVGPYYGPSAPRCCPTKPTASAALQYRAGAWRVKPNYFALSGP